MPRTLAIGDIHGCYNALTTLLTAAHITKDDLLITLGDYTDRGPQSADTLTWLAARFAAGNLIALRGNHDLTMMEARTNWVTFENWLTWGGDTTLKSYGWDGKQVNWPDLVPEAHWDFLDKHTQLYHETANHFFVHADAYHDVPLAEQPEYKLLWEKFSYQPAHVNGKMMVCGHTSQKSGLPLFIGHAICIDTRVFDEGGWLTCFDIDTGQYWQANEKHESRTGHVSELD